MKKYHLFKIVQLSILAVFLVVCIMILMQSNMKQMIFSDGHATLLFYVMWLMLLANFLFIFADFHLISQVKLSYHDLYEVAYSDSIGSIPNRFSCDTIIEKYIEQSLPDGIGCIMMSISNLYEVNNTLGRKAGNELLKDFSSILTNASGDLCFVGRNGGNKFLAVFEDCTDARFRQFLDAVDSRIRSYNHDESTGIIEYKAGKALSTTDDIRDITKLISLSDRRLVGNMANTHK